MQHRSSETRSGLIAIGGSAYSSTPAQAAKPKGILPVKTYLSFKQANVAAAKTKITQLNGELKASSVRVLLSFDESLATDPNRKITVTDPHSLTWHSPTPRQRTLKTSILFSQRPDRQGRSTMLKLLSILLCVGLKLNASLVSNRSPSGHLSRNTFSYTGCHSSWSRVSSESCANEKQYLISLVSSALTQPLSASFPTSLAFFSRHATRCLQNHRTSQGIQTPFLFFVQLPICSRRLVGAKIVDTVSGSWTR
jgi:hypothetical protein